MTTFPRMRRQITKTEQQIQWAFEIGIRQIAALYLWHGRWPQFRLKRRQGRRIVRIAGGRESFPEDGVRQAGASPPLFLGGRKVRGNMLWF